MSRLNLIEQEALLKAFSSTELMSALRKFQQDRVTDSNERIAAELRAPNPNVSRSLRYVGEADAWGNFLHDLEKFANQDAEG